MNDSGHPSAKAWYERALDAVIEASAIVATIGLGAIVVMYCIEIFSRYFLNAPTTWANDFIVFTLCAAIFVMMPEITRSGGHVAVTLLTDLMPEKFSPRCAPCAGVRWLRGMPVRRLHQPAGEHQPICQRFADGDDDYRAKVDDHDVHHLRSWRFRAGISASGCFSCAARQRQHDRLKARTHAHRHNRSCRCDHGAADSVRAWAADRRGVPAGQSGRRNVADGSGGVRHVRQLPCSTPAQLSNLRQSRCFFWSANCCSAGAP